MGTSLSILSVRSLTTELKWVLDMVVSLRGKNICMRSLRKLDPSNSFTDIVFLMFMNLVQLIILKSLEGLSPKLNNSLFVSSAV